MPLEHGLLMLSIGLSEVSVDFCCWARSTINNNKHQQAVASLFLTMTMKLPLQYGTMPPRVDDTLYPCNAAGSYLNGSGSG